MYKIILKRIGKREKKIKRERTDREKIRKECIRLEKKVRRARTHREKG